MPFSGGSPTIGTPVVKGTAGSVLYIDGSTNLAQDNPGFTYIAGSALTLKDNLHLAEDNTVIWLGKSTDVGISFDASNLVINAANVGANVEIRHTNFDLYHFDNALTSTGTGTFGEIIDNGLSASLPVYTNGSKQLVSKTVTVDVPIVLSMFDAKPERASESNWNGGLLKLDDAAAVNSGAPFVMTTKGSGKIVIIVNAGGDLVGDITLTGTSVDRNTGVQTASDTSVITINGTTTDNSTTDANSNVVHAYTKAYISDKWFTGVVTITTTDVAITDMDVFHVSFEQVNDSANLTLNTLDANIFTTNAAAEFDAYLYTLQVTGDECDIAKAAELHVGAVGGAKAQTALTDKYFRLRQGNIATTLDGTTDGLWVDVAYANSPVYVEDVTLKVWLTATITPDAV
jgi:hypothetical protein